MKRIARNPVSWAGLALLALFWGVAAIVPNASLMEGLRAIQIAVAVVVVVAYFPIVMETLRQHGRPGRVQQLTLGITLGFASVALNGLYSLLWRLAGQPMWMANSDLNGFWIWMSILAAVLHVTAPGAVNGVVPRRNWIMIGIAFGAGALTAAIILTTQPDVRRIVDFLEPILSEL